MENAIEAVNAETMNIMETRVQIRILRICLFTEYFKAIFCEIDQSKLSFLAFYNFYLSENQQVSVYTSNLTICIYLTPKSLKLCPIFFYLDMAPNLIMKSLQHFPIPSQKLWELLTKFSWITSEKITQFLEAVSVSQ